jgi:hypothetical protein
MISCPLAGGNVWVMTRHTKVEFPSTIRLEESLLLLCMSCFLGPHTRVERGRLKIKIWHDVVFFMFSLFSPLVIMTSAVTYSPKSSSKAMISAMFHVIFGHASARQVWSTIRSVGVDVHADAWCTCLICSSCKTQPSSRRKFKNGNVPAAQSTGNVFRSNNPDMQAGVWCKHCSSCCSCFPGPCTEGNFALRLNRRTTLGLSALILVVYLRYHGCV